MGALFDFKCTCDSRLVYICQADAEKCIFVWTILSQTPRRTPQVTSDAGRISTRIFWLFPKERRMLRKRDYQGRLSFHFFDRWMTNLATHRQKKSPSNVLEKFADARILPFYMELNGTDKLCTEPYKREGENNENLCKTVIFQWIRMKFRTQIRNQNRNNLTLFLEEI